MSHRVGQHVVAVTARSNELAEVGGVVPLELKEEGLLAERELPPETVQRNGMVDDRAGCRVYDLPIHLVNGAGEVVVSIVPASRMRIGFQPSSRN